MTRSSQFQHFMRLLQRARLANLVAENKTLPISRLVAKQKGLSAFSRRRFLKLTGYGAGSAIAAPLLSQWQGVGSQSIPKIAIVGGGLAGLNAAYHLKKAGLTATVYEARNRLGGRIFSATNIVGENLVVDLGGAFINSDHDDLLALIKAFDLTLFDLDLEAQSSPIPETLFFLEGRPWSPQELADKLRPIAAQIAEDARLVDSNFDRYTPELDRLSVKDYLDRHASKMTGSVIRTLIEASIRTEYGVEPEQSSALQLLFLLPTVEGEQIDLLSESDERYLVVGGSSRLIDGLETALAEQIQLKMRLTQIENQGEKFKLYFAGRAPIEADWVILAMPSPILRNLNLNVKIPAKLRRFINEVSLGSNEKLIAGFNKKIWLQAQGFSEDAWTDLGFAGAWVETKRQPEQSTGALTFFFGGREVAPVQTESAAFQGNQVLKQLETAIAQAQTASNGHFTRTQWTKDRLTQGSYTNFQPGQFTEFSDCRYLDGSDPDKRQEVRSGNLIFAGEQFSDEFYGYMNGAAQTGRLAAAIILREQNLKKS